MQQQGLTITDLAELSVNTFFQHRYQIRRPDRDARAILKKLLAYLRTVGIIAVPVKAVADPARVRKYCAGVSTIPDLSAQPGTFNHPLLSQHGGAFP